MANSNVHSEGVRLQADRVVSAYRELRNTAHSADFTSDDFPVGKFAELFQQIKALAGWLEPDSWRSGADLALELIDSAGDLHHSASLEAQYREVGEPQNNFVAGYLEQVMQLGDPRATEAFAAVLSEYISSCEGGGVPDVELLRKLAASPPRPGTGEIVEHDDEQPVNDLKARCEAIGYRLYVTADGGQLVVDHNAPHDKTEVVFIHVDDDDDKLEDWLADREQVSERVRRSSDQSIAEQKLGHCPHCGRAAS